MVESGADIQRVIEEMTGNEALLEMLDTEPAAEMLNWGIEMATSLVKRNEGTRAAAGQELLPRLKAVRQVMRSVGNWAAGKYADPASRVQLRDNLLGYFKAILGGEARLPSAVKLDEILNQVDDESNTPRQLIVKLKHLLEESS